MRGCDLSPYANQPVRAQAKKSDDLSHPLGERQRALRETATQQLIDARPAPVMFDDRNPDRYWSALNPGASTKVAGSGTQISVEDTSRNGDQMLVRVGFTK